MPNYRFVTADVFTAKRFGGNQLAVLPDARGLTDEQMLAITREFNYSESTFVFPPDDAANTRRVRIFTPSGEIPFAGHPTVGTAFALAAIGEVPLSGARTRVVLEEGVGPVPVEITVTNGQPTVCQFSTARLPEVGPPLPSRADLARCLSIDEADVMSDGWSPQIVSCGLGFSFVRVKDRGVVARSRLHMESWEKHLANTPGHGVMIFALDAEEPGHDVRARMFGPGFGVPEDPATGSACAALGGYLAARSKADGTQRWVVEQGYEMGRPSLIDVEADRTGGKISAIRVGGASVLVSEGRITA